MLKMFEKNKDFNNNKIENTSPQKNLKIQDDILLWEHYVQKRLKFVLYT